MTNIKLVKKIMDEISGKPVPVVESFNSCSYAKHGVFVDKDIDYIVEVNLKEYGICLDPSNYGIYKYLPTEQAELWDKYPHILFDILHEIGHTETLVGLKYSYYEKRTEGIEKLKAKNTPIPILKQKYRNLPKERRADKWAYTWALKHPKEMAKFSKMIKDNYSTP